MRFLHGFAVFGMTALCNRHPVGILPQAKLARTESTKKVCVANPHSRISAVVMKLRFIAGMTMVVLLAVLAITPAHAACLNPAGSEGDVIYNSSHNVPQYCDGSDNWIAMVGGDPVLGPISGLIGYWKLDETTGTAAVDSSVSGNNGSYYAGLSPATDAIDGKVGKALTFNRPSAIGQYIDTASISTFSSVTAFTVVTWIKSEQLSDFQGIIDIDLLLKLYLQFNSGQIRIEASGWSGSPGIWRQASGGHVAVDTWTHVAVTYDYGDPVGTPPVLYINGQVYAGALGQPGTPSGTYTPAANTVVTIGGAYISGLREFRGPMDDVRVYDRELSPSEIQEIYNQTASSYTTVVPNGLVGHWRLDETSGTTAADSSVNGNDGTMSGGLSGADTVNGVVATGLNFDGSDDIITVTDIPAYNPTGELTVSAWVKLDSYKPLTSFLVGKADSSGTEWAMFIEDTLGNGQADTLSFALCTGANAGCAPGPTNFHRASVTTSALSQTNRWYHVAVVYDDAANSIDFYIDGNLIPSAASYGSPHTQSIVASNIDITMGEVVNGEELEGSLDDVRIYSSALTAPEIREIYEARDSIRYNESYNVPEYFDGNRWVSMTREWQDVTNGLVGHWKLDETTGTTITDSTGYGNDGTMANGLDAANDSVPGAVGTALNLDAADDIVSMPHIAAYAPTGEMSVSFWLNVDQFISDMFFITKRNSPDNEWSIYMDSSQRLLFDFCLGVNADCSGANFAAMWTTTTPLSVNTWHHVVLTYDDANDDIDFWVDGVEQPDAAAWNNPYNQSINASTLPINFGTLWTDIGASGSLDDVRLYNRVLTSAEIQALHNMGTPLGQNTAAVQGCASAGDVCDDGTLYVSTHPADGQPLYTTPEDAPGFYTWNNGNNANYAATSQTNNNYGDTNTNGIVLVDSDTATAGHQPHQAAQYCYDLVAHGADDWYLPTRNEATRIYWGGDDLGIDTTAQYWTSKENGNSTAFTKDMSDNGNAARNKQGNFRVRCIRKGAAPRCANPYGLEGAMIYNTTHDIVQYCDGARWIGVGKKN